MAETEIEKAEKRVEQAKVRLAALKARQSAKARKADTRRKIILGGGLMERAARGDDLAKRLVADIVNGLTRDADQRVFVELQPDNGRTR